MGTHSSAPQQANIEGGNRLLSILWMNLIFLYIHQLGPNLGKENLHLLYRPAKDTRKHAHTDRLGPRRDRGSSRLRSLSGLDVSTKIISHPNPLTDFGLEILRPAYESMNNKLEGNDNVKAARTSLLSLGHNPIGRGMISSVKFTYPASSAHFFNSGPGAYERCIVSIASLSNL
jgi:hypothetical protein